MGLRDPGGVIVHELGEKHKLYFLYLFITFSSQIASDCCDFCVCLVSWSSLLCSWLAVQLWLDEAAGLWTRVNTVDWVRAIKSLCHSQFDGSSPSFARCTRTNVAVGMEFVFN